MRKIKYSVHYPFLGIEDDEYIFEVEDNATEKEIEDIAQENIKELVFNRISTDWEEIK